MKSVGFGVTLRSGPEEERQWTLRDLGHSDSHSERCGVGWHDSTIGTCGCLDPNRDEKLGFSRCSQSLDG